MSAIDVLDVLDRLDVPSLAVFTVYGFWRVVGLLSKIEKRFAIEEQKHEQLGLALDRHELTLQEHAKQDHEDKNRIYDRLNELREKIPT